MRKVLFPIMFSMVVAVLLLGGVHSYAATELVFNQRDSDTANIHLGDLGLGYEARLTLRYEVQLSSWEGDDEITDGELVFSANGVNYRVWVGLGDDNVIVTVSKDGSVAYEKELGHQQGWTRQTLSGTVDVRVERDCNGVTSIYVNGQRVLSTGSDPTRAVALMGDDDAVLLANLKLTSCGSNSDDIIESGWSITGYAVGAAVIATVAGLILSLRGG